MTTNGIFSVAHKKRNIYSACHFLGNTGCQLLQGVFLMRKLEEMSFLRSDFFGSCCDSGYLNQNAAFINCTNGWWCSAAFPLSEVMIQTREPVATNVRQGWNSSLNLGALGGLATTVDRSTLKSNYWTAADGLSLHSERLGLYCCVLCFSVLPSQTEISNLNILKV